MIKLVAFDLDGTIGDTIPLCVKAFKMAVEPYIKRELSEEEITQTFGLDEEGMVKQIIANDNWELALNDFYTIYQELHSLCSHPYNGIKDLVEELKNNSMPVILITGKGRRGCEITLHQFGMERCFERIETGSPIENRKSEAIKNLLDSYNLRPNEMVYIGDAVSDITECDKAGIRCLSAAWGVSPVTIHQLKEQNQKNIFHSVESLRKFLIKSLHSTED